MSPSADLDGANANGSEASRLSGNRGLGWLACGFAVVALLLHAAHLVYASTANGCTGSSLACPSGNPLWAAGDYGTYHVVAEQIREEGVLGASYLRRTPGYPLLLIAGSALSGTEQATRWAGPLLASAAAAALVCLGGWLTGRRAGAWIAGAIFLVWWNAYQFSGALQTDGPHAFLAVVALALTLVWRKRGGNWIALATAVTWGATQLLRPTLFAIPLLLPLLLFGANAARGRRGTAIALWASTLLVPCFVIASNSLHHGVNAPSHIVTVNLRCYAVPRLQEELGQGKFRRLRRECLARFRDMEPALRARTERDEAIAFLSAHPVDAVVSHVVELGIQLVEPLRLYAVPRQSHLYPAWWEFGEVPLIAFWLFGCAGVARLAQRDRGLAVFLLGTAAVILLPASFAHYTGGRLRFPLDLFFIPAAAIPLERGWRLLAERRERQSR